MPAPDSPSTKTDSIVQVAVPSPLRRVFDYLRATAHTPQPGTRVEVPFGRGKAVGVVLGVQQASDVPAGRLKPAGRLLDETPVLPPDIVALAQWASDYYHHPIGEVFSQALPVLLRKGEPARVRGLRHWRLTRAGAEAEPAALARAPRQAHLLACFRPIPEGLGAEALDAAAQKWRPAAARLVDKGWVAVEERSCLAAPAANGSPNPEHERVALNADQGAAVEALAGSLDGFGAFLLDGVTGSGKTEVYLSLIERVLALGRQALVLAPEIGLTPQLLGRFRARFDVPIAVLHSGLTDQERLCAWLAARDGTAPIVIGTRSAVFTPLRAPGAFIVDEEHDLSFKQQEGFRYSARDVAVVRAHRAGVPVVMGSATPSLEALANVAQGRYRELRLPSRAGSAKAPAMRVLDIRHQPMVDNLSAPLRQAMARHLEAGGQVLLFLNRRGYAPTLLCHDCGWVASCRRCDAHMTVHQRDNRLRCHHCGAERPLEEACPDCGSVDLRGLGYGTERLTQAVQEAFPGRTVLRIDRDSTRRKGAMEDLLAEATAGRASILIGTQMLAKGHHFPNVTLVGILDTDQGLYSADFRGPERMAQLIVQVAGRAGRAERPGEVLIQTHHPDHPLLATLIAEGYPGFARAALAERREARLPPFGYAALLRAEAVDAEAPLAFLAEARELAAAEEAACGGEVELLGPVPSPMERRAGRYRAQLLLQSGSRSTLHRLLDTWAPALEGLKSGRRVRWSLDVDPQEMF